MDRLRHFSRHIVLLLPLVLLHACAGGAGNGVSEADLTPAQRDLRQKVGSMNQTVWEAGALGAAGTVLWYAFLDVPAPTAAVPVASAEVTAAYVEERKQQYADREALLEAMTTDVRQKNQQAQALIESMRVVVDEDTRRLAALTGQYQQKLISDRDYQQQLAVIKSDREEIRKAIDGAEAQLTTFKDAKTVYETENAGVDTSQFSAEIGVLQASINVMSDIVTDLAAPELG